MGKDADRRAAAHPLPLRAGRALLILQYRVCHPGGGALPRGRRTLYGVCPEAYSGTAWDDSLCFGTEREDATPPCEGIRDDSWWREFQDTTEGARGAWLQDAERSDVHNGRRSSAIRGLPGGRRTGGCVE